MTAPEAMKIAAEIAPKADVTERCDIAIELIKAYHRGCSDESKFWMDNLYPDRTVK